MELYQLKSFLIVARERNLTRASAELHLSQSALSSQIKQLEGELGLNLFRRTARGMELTEGGLELLAHAEEILEGAQKLYRKARALNQQVGESVTVGLNADPGFLRVGPINRRLSLLHGDLNVSFVTSQTVRTPQLLRQGLLDLAFFYGEATDLDIGHLLLCRVRICIVLPAPLDPGENAGWAEIAALPWIWVSDSPFHNALMEQMERRRLLPPRAVTAADEHIVRELVKDGQGLALMREDEARPLAECGRVRIWEQGWMTLPLSLAWLEKHGGKKRIRATREAIRHIWQDAGRESEDGTLVKYWL